MRTSVSAAWLSGRGNGPRASADSWPRDTDGGLVAGRQRVPSDAAGRTAAPRYRLAWVGLSVLAQLNSDGSLLSDSSCEVRSKACRLLTRAP